MEYCVAVDQRNESKHRVHMLGHFSLAWWLFDNDSKWRHGPIRLNFGKPKFRRIGAATSRFHLLSSSHSTTPWTK